MLLKQVRERATEGSDEEEEEERAIPQTQEVI